MKGNESKSIDNGEDRLVADFQAVLADGEELLNATANQGGEKIAAIRMKMSERLTDAKHKLTAAQHIIAEKARATAKATDQYVHENPWQSVLVAAGVGFIIGFISHRMTTSSKS
ncbi:MAG: DUF883 family protein [Gammaproteobacteria bacterium]